MGGSILAGVARARVDAWSSYLACVLPTASQREALVELSSSIGSIAVSRLSGVNRGSVMTFSMVLTSLLRSKASSCSFLALRATFGGLPYDHYVLRVLFSSLLDICGLAVEYDPALKSSIAVSLMSLPRSSLDVYPSACN